MRSRDYLIWLDLEMTGLDPDHHVILQIGCAVTDNQLNVVVEGPSLTIHQSEEVLARMDEWCVKHHGQSGLTEMVRRSRLSLEQAELQTLAFLQQYCEPGASPLCGNSIGQDRRFLYKYMPKLSGFFHYRNIDVSSIKELAHRWYPAARKGPEKKKTHHVLDDVRESIEELRHYRLTVFK